VTLGSAQPLTASGRGWTERGFLAFVLVGVAVVALKLGVVVSAGPTHAAAVGGRAAARVSARRLGRLGDL
jgi:hypothetical protein